VADGLLAGWLALTEAEAGLAQVGSVPPWRIPIRRPARCRAPPAGRVETGHTLRWSYVPMLPAATQFDDLPFQQAES
jgi:hypothetical protein